MNKEKNQNNKYRIDEMFSEILETETMNTEEDADLIRDKLSNDEKERIFGMVMEKMGGERIVMKTRGKRRWVLVAALVAVFAFATTAFAAEIFQWDTRISNYLGIGEQNKAELSASGMNIGVSSEKNGVRIDAVQSIGDGNNMYILLDVTAPEGTVIYPNSRFDGIYLMVEGATGMGYGCDMLPDANENDNKATFMISMEANREISSKMIDIKFKNLGHFVPDSPDIVSDFKGDWELKWKLDYQDISTEYTIGKELIVNGETLKVDSISVSPIAFNVKISGNYIREYDSAPPEPGSGDLIQIKAVTLKDGTVLTQDDAGGWGTSVNGSEYMINMRMKQLIDTDQVKSITLNDTVFELNQK
jgi:hypothetical protein